MHELLARTAHHRTLRRPRRILPDNTSPSASHGAQPAVSEAALLELAQDAIIVRDPHDRIVLWNRGAQTVYGWTRREALGRVVHDFLRTRFPTDKADALATLRRDGIWEGLLHQETRDRGEVTTWSRWAAMRDADGKIVSVLEVNRDVTRDQRLIEELRGRILELEGASARLRDDANQDRAILDSALDPIISVGDDHRIVLFNAAAERALGVRAADAIGELLDRFIPTERSANQTGPVGDEDAAETLPRTFERPGEHTARRADGSEFPIDATVSDVRVGAHGFRTVIFRDATERRLLEEQFRQAQKMEAIGRLAGGIAHDFNNILSAITGYLEFVRPAISDPIALADLGEVKSAADRAAQLTRQLLIFSRSQVTRPRSVHPNEVVSGIDKLLRRVIGEDVRLVTRLSGDVERVRIDPAQFEQALLNLAINARDAMPTGGTLTIATRMRPASPDVGDAPTGPEAPSERRAVVIEVSDTGVGMDEATRVRAMEPFFTTKEPERGTGLGLPAVSSVAAQAGGRVDIESELGVGTRVILTFPAAGAADAEEDQSRIRVGARVSESGRRVLLVEDEDTVRALARRLLESRGYAVIEARTGEDALARWHDASARGDVVDIVVTDVVMPDMGGRELVLRLRRLRPGLPVVYMSGYLADAVSGLDLSAPAQLIEKPFTGESLGGAVAAVLGQAVPRR